MAAGPLVEALHWAMLDFWAILAAFAAAVINMVVIVRNQIKLDRIMKDLAKITESWGEDTEHKDGD